MSVKVENITKFYGEQKALDDVTFEISAGEVVGFLGPNGAGKSTMMKIICCFIPQSLGSVTVHGYDNVNDSLEVRKIVGYLPEHNPLYHEMYVKEYLTFIGGIHLKSNMVASRVNEMVDLTGLGPEQHKKIGALSKGYRQRVGLAQAMLHDPEVLILDEPTTGLDPNQLVEIRNLIRDIGKEKTVLLSTHIMQEVEAICNRVIIINNGVIAADDKTSVLQQKIESELLFEVEFDKEVPINDLKGIDGVTSIEKKGINRYAIACSPENDIRSKLFEWAVTNNYKVLTLNTSENSLENVFQNPYQLT